jgi:putative copper resistance protein D
LADQNHPAHRLLLRNALLETALGIVVVVIVGSLGIMVPAAHQAPVWPFNYTLALSWIPTHEVLDSRAALFVAGLTAAVSAVVASVGVWKRRRAHMIFGLAGIASACAVAFWVLLVPAHPTTYAASPVPYNVSTIVAGSALYAQHCSACHGREGHGDGPDATSLPIKPADLPEHALDHRPGDLFWLIAHGTPRATMPAFSPAISDAEIWTLIRFLRAQADAEKAKSMTSDVHEWRPVLLAAPDFTFEFPQRGQESLNEQRGRFDTLLVFYTPPQSLPRLRELATAEAARAAAGLRILALPTSASTAAGSDSANDSESIFPRASPDVFAAYSMFARGADTDSAPPTHVEFLIDRQGYLRARWLGVPDSASDRTAEIRRQIEMLAHVGPYAAPMERHSH